MYIQVSKINVMLFKLLKNAGKIMIPIDKPRERTVATLGVSLRTVDRVWNHKLQVCIYTTQ